MSKGFLLVLVAFLAACGSREAPQTNSDQAQLLQCAKDTDCKGNRICDSGACINPTTEPLVGAQVQAVAPTATTTSNDSDEELQGLLIAALRQKPGTSERIGNSADAIIGYANAGYVGAKPDSRSDYSDYRILKKPAQFLGHTLVAIEEEYMQEYVGCCVSPGMAVTVQLSPNGDNLDTFAAKSGCSVSRDTDGHYSANVIGLPQAPKGTYATLECKERDLKEGA